MAELVYDCPRCGSSKITFNLLSAFEVGTKYSWQHWYEAFCICRRCLRSTVFVLADKETSSNKMIDNFGSLEKVGGVVNHLVRVETFICIKDLAIIQPPEHLPDSIKAAFFEGSKCYSFDCYNASGTMFRLSIDLATKSLLPENNTNGLNDNIRRSLGLRLNWLFDQRILPETMRELSTCIKEDGNDGAHAGSLCKDDIEDLIDFTKALLERLYTEPERLRLAKERRDARRNSNT